MSMSTHVIGFTPPDETWHKMKAAWDACENAGVPIPGAVLDFFGDEEPDPAGVETEIPAREYHGRDAAGYEIDVSSIPSKVTVIRFVNSW